jgi:Tetratricopeptide repeat/Anaphase-promoting complex subunit 5
LAAYPRFRLTAKNAPAITEICLRLDGIPLAIELAAARTKVFPPEQIAARLDDRFRLLTGGSRAAMERHQTLRALIDWSYDLLSESERALLRRLSVFAGGWSYEAAQAVCGNRFGEEVLDTLARLADKSLVVVEERMEEPEGRYHLLETIRQYARDKLYEASEAEQARDCHLDYFVHFAEAAEPKLRGAEQMEWLERLETEHDNMRTALAWSLESDKRDAALRLAGALFWFWHTRGYSSEGQDWLAKALALDERERERAAAAGENSPSRAEQARRAKALAGAGMLLAYSFTDFETAGKLLEESLRMWRALEDKWWMAVVLNVSVLSTILVGESEGARTRIEEGVALARQVGDKWALVVILGSLGRVLQDIDVRAAQPIAEEQVAVARSVGDKSLLTRALRNLADIYYLLGDPKAIPVAEEALATARAIHDKFELALTLWVLAGLTSLQGELDKARTYAMQLLALSREIGTVMYVGFATISLAYVACASGQAERGVRILAAIVTLARRVGIDAGMYSGAVGNMFKQIQERAQAQLGTEAFQAAWVEGQQLTLEQAIALATSDQS